MTDERRWTIWRCPHVLLDEAECGYTVSRDVYGELHQHGPFCPYAHPEPVELVPVVVVPVSSVVPITRLREWIALNAEAEIAYERAKCLVDLSKFLDDVECASNPNNERTT